MFVPESSCAVHYSLQKILYYGLSMVNRVYPLIAVPPHVSVKGLECHDILVQDAFRSTCIIRLDRGRFVRVHAHPPHKTTTYSPIRLVGLTGPPILWRTTKAFLTQAQSMVDPAGSPTPPEDSAA